MLRVRSITARIPVGPATAADSWSEMKSHRWVRTSLHRVVDLPITICVCDVATSFTTGQWSAISAGVRWKKFLSQLRARTLDLGSARPASRLARCRLQRDSAHFVSR
jgi:hypothetical protein